MVKEEKETIISFNEADDEAEVYTYNKKFQNKLDRLCDEYDDFTHKAQCETGAKTYLVPKARVSISKPIKRRELTEKERKELVERLNKGKNKSK